MPARELFKVAPSIPISNREAQVNSNFQRILSILISFKQKTHVLKYEYFDLFCTNLKCDNIQHGC